jgi:hypothetical protein
MILAKTQHRSIGGQIERWADIGKAFQGSQDSSLKEILESINNNDINYKE